MATRHDALWKKLAAELADGIRTRRYSCVDVMTSVVDRFPKLNRPERESIGETTQVYACIQPTGLKEAMNLYESRALEVLSALVVPFEAIALPTGRRAA